MQLPAGKILEGEVIAPGAAIDVIVQKHPLINSPMRYKVGVGQSLAEILQDCFPNRNGRPMTCHILHADGEDAIPPEWWRHVRPKSGTTIVFWAVTTGKFAKALAMIAVVALAIVGAVFLGPIVGTALGISGLFGGQLVAGVITIAGSLAVQALFPTKAKKNSEPVTESAQNVFSISGAQNQARPFGSVPVILGTHKISPPYAGQPYTEYLGNDQYLTVVFCNGYGPLSPSDYRIGETPITNFSLTNFEVTQGYPSEPQISFYPTDVHQEDLSIKLLAGVANIRTTEEDTDYISIDFSAPEGISKFYPDTGIRGNIYIGFSIYYAPAGTGAWILLFPDIVPFSYGLNALRAGYSWYTPSRGRWDVMITRNYPDATDVVNEKDSVFWTALRSTTFTPPIQFDVPLSLSGIKIKATDQLSGVVDTFNLVVSSLHYRFNGSNWSEFNVSSNPADIFRLVLQGPANKMPVPDSQLDIPKIQDWWAFCVNQGFTYNAVIEDTRSVYNVISEVCAAGRAVPTWRDGKWSVIWDNWTDPIVQHFTPRNSRDFKGDRIYKKMPHGLRVQFINALQGYAQDEMIVYDDGYGPGNATIFEQVEFPGVTYPNLIWRHGRYHIAQARLRPEFYSLTVDMEHLRCTRGDRVRVQHDVALIGQISGRVKSVTGFVVELDETITIVPGKQYSIRWRTAAGDSGILDVVNTVGEGKSVTLATAGGVPAAGDLFMFGEKDSETGIFRVFSVANQDSLSATLVLVDDAPEIIHADTGPIPEFNSHITQPVDPYGLPPRNLSVVEVVQGSGDNATALVRFSWLPAHGRDVKSFEAQIKDESHAEMGWTDRQVVNYPQTHIDFTGILLGTYSFRVRTIFENDSVSNWAELNASQITGVHLSSPLPDVTNLRTSFVDGVTAIGWDQVIDFRPIQYEIRRGQAWESALLMEVVSQPPFAARGAGTYWIAAVSRPVQGLVVYSAHPASLTITGSRLVDNVVAVRDEKADDWPGVFVGTAGKSGTDIRSAGAAPFLSNTDFLGMQSFLDQGGEGDGGYYIADARTIDAGSIVKASVTIDYDGTGSALTDSILDVPDFLAAPDFLGAQAARFVEVYPLVGVKDNVGDAWVWQRWQPGVYVARYYTAAMMLITHDAGVSAYCLGFKLTVDVPDRIERYTGLAIPAAGLTITFKPEGAASPAPFNGGPSGSTVPNVQVTIINSNSDDNVYLSARTLSSVTIRILNSGIGVARTCDVVVQGW